MRGKATTGILYSVFIIILSSIVIAGDISISSEMGGPVFSEISMKTIFLSLPESVFDNTTGGINQQEMLMLCQNFESDNWNVTYCVPGHLTI